MKKIGLIGVGTMGRGMATNLENGGYAVIAYHPKVQKIKDIETEVIHVTDDLTRMQETELVITCLPSDDALQEVLFEKKLLDQLKGKILIDSGTTSVELTQKISEHCKHHRIEFLDAPVTGSKLGAQNGTMTYMIGGTKELYDQCLPLLQCMGKVHVYCGENTFGQRAKVALNLTQALLLESYFEGIVLGLKQGVSLDAMQQVLENSAAKNGVGTFKLPFIKNRDFDQHFMHKLMHKDLKLAKNQIEKLGAQLPLAHHICDVFDKSADRGHEDFCTIVKDLEQDNDVQIK